MNHSSTMEGRLLVENGIPVIRKAGGETARLPGAVWEGYLLHFLNQEVCARLLPQTDYVSGQPIVLIWPKPKPAVQPFLAIYYNERLPNYPGSLFGHAAININGRIFNFAHKLNENEELDEAEYFYRPALGEFSPGPNGARELADPHHPYYDKFGRRFMRAVFSLKVESIKGTDWLARYFRKKIAKIQSLKAIPGPASINANFHFLFNNCATVLYRGLREWGIKNLNRWFPRDLFLSCFREFEKRAKVNGWRISAHKLPQLKVREAPWSKGVPILNPRNLLYHLTRFKTSL